MLLNANSKRNLIVLLFVCLVVLSIPMFLRVKLVDGAYIGEDSFYNFNLGKLVSEEGFVHWDDLSFFGRELRYEYGLPVLLSGKPEILIWVIPILFGLLSLWLFYLILKRYDSDIALIASILLLFSPPFIYLFSTATKFSGAVLFCLLGVYLFLRGSKFRVYSLLSFVLVAFFSVELSLILVLIGLYFGYRKVISFKEYFVYLVGIAVILFLEFGKSLLNFGIFFQNYFTDSFSEGLAREFFDISGGYGFGIFIFILALLGLYQLGSERYRYLGFYALVVLTISILVYLPFLIYAFNFVLVVLAAYGIVFFIDMEWKDDLFRILTLIVVFCGVLFSGLSFLAEVPEITPDKGLYEAINFIKINITKDYAIFSDIDNGIFLNYAGKKNLWDNSFVVSDFSDVKAQNLRVINSDKIREVRDLFDSKGVKFVLTSKKMVEKYYTNDESKMMFILKYSRNDFYREFENKEGVVWGVFERRDNVV